MRYEVAVETNLTFHTRRPPYQIDRLPGPETVAIEFEGRRFVWHAIAPDADGEKYWPTVTTLIADSEDYAAEREAMERFLSALSYSTEMAIEGVNYGGAGRPGEMDPPVARALRRGLADHVYDAPAEVVAERDDRLRVVFAHYRDGLNAGSPFFRFMAFWNALDVACEDHAGQLPAWLRERAAAFWHVRGGNPPDPEPPDVDRFLRNSSRDAIAHAVRSEERPALDPDVAADRRRASLDAGLVRQLVRVRVHERWGEHPVWRRPRPE